MKNTNPLPVIALSVALLATACTSNSPTSLEATSTTAVSTTDVAQDATTPPSTTASATTAADTAASSTEASDDSLASFGLGESAENLDIADFVQRVGLRYSAAVDVWPGFTPNEHPVVVALKDGDSKTFAAVALNVAKPEALGDAEALDTAGTPFSSVHKITNLTSDTAEKLDRMQNFDFHMQLDGVDSFAITAGPQLDPSDLDYPATLIHELFHRWQDESFSPNASTQDVAGYNYSKENLELAVLEQRALSAAVDATSDDARMEASRHYAALRLLRSEDPRIILDNAQEQVEGSARYIEHMTYTEGGGYGPDQFAWEMKNEFETGGGIKDWFGFGRFYSSGAAAIEVATKLGVEDPFAKIEQGAFPADLIIEATGVTKGDVDALVSDARATYDPDGSVAKGAEDAEERAAEEDGDIFGDGGETTSETVEEAIELTQEQSDCIGDAIGDGNIIPDEVFERCVGDDA